MIFSKTLLFGKSYHSSLGRDTIQRKQKDFDSKNDGLDNFLLDMFEKEKISDNLQDFFQVFFPRKFRSRKKFQLRTKNFFIVKNQRPKITNF